MPSRGHIRPTGLYLTFVCRTDKATFLVYSYDTVKRMQSPGGRKDLRTAPSAGAAAEVSGENLWRTAEGTAKFPWDLRASTSRRRHRRPHFPGTALTTQYAVRAAPQDTEM